MAISGPPVLSTERTVESSRRPCVFVYGQQWQGFAFDESANRGMVGAQYGRQSKMVNSTPAVNYVPRLDNAPASSKH